MKVRVGTRASVLALRQATIVADMITALSPEFQVEVRPMQTTGDVLYNANLSAIGGKGLFTKELDQALLDDAIDIAVHSLKDVQSLLHDDLVIGAFLKRDDPRDALITASGCNLADLPIGSVIGTSSSRRAAFLHHLRPDCSIVPFRGNIDTRVKKVMSSKVDACVLSYAGLQRLALDGNVSEVFDFAHMIPAVGQGVICVEMLKESPLMKFIKLLNDETTEICCSIERAFQMELGANCTAPVAGYASIVDDIISLDTMFFTGNKIKLARQFCSVFEDANMMARRCAEMLLSS